MCLTPNMIFDMCNIWVILRRNIIYLFSKNLILIINFLNLIVKVFGYDVIKGELQISFPLFVAPKIHLMTSYPETLIVKS